MSFDILLFRCTHVTQKNDNAAPAFFSFSLDVVHLSLLTNHSIQQGLCWYFRKMVSKRLCFEEKDSRHSKCLCNVVPFIHVTLHWCKINHFQPMVLNEELQQFVVVVGTHAEAGHLPNEMWRKVWLWCSVRCAKCFYFQSVISVYLPSNRYIPSCHLSRQKRTTFILPQAGWDDM